MQICFNRSVNEEEKQRHDGRFLDSYFARVTKKKQFQQDWTLCLPSFVQIK